MGCTRRVQRSFAFVDLCGFCDFADGLGDDTAARELACLRGSIREVASRFGVRVDKWLGDGAMLVGVEDEPLVACVIAVSDVHRSQGELSLRAGVARGDVLLLEGDDYVGRPVNLAARLCDMADPGEVLASPAGLHLPNWAEVREKTTVLVRGFSKPVPVVTVGARRSKGSGSGREPRRLGSVVDGLAQPIRALLGGRPTEAEEAP